MVLIPFGYDAVSRSSALNVKSLKIETAGSNVIRNELIILIKNTGETFINGNMQILKSLKNYLMKAHNYKKDRSYLLLQMKMYSKFITKVDLEEEQLRRFPSSVQITLTKFGKERLCIFPHQLR